MADAMPRWTDKNAARDVLGIRMTPIVWRCTAGSRGAERWKYSARKLPENAQLLRQLSVWKWSCRWSMPTPRQFMKKLKRRGCADLAVHLLDGMARGGDDRQRRLCQRIRRGGAGVYAGKCPMVVGTSYEKPFTFWLAKRLVKTGICLC